MLIVDRPVQPMNAHFPIVSIPSGIFNVKVFRSFWTVYFIKKILTKKKRPTLTGRTEWNDSMVKAIMYNEVILRIRDERRI